MRWEGPLASGEGNTFSVLTPVRIRGVSVPSPVRHSQALCRPQSGEPLNIHSCLVLWDPFRSTIRIYRYELPWHVAFRHSHDDTQSSYNILYAAFEQFFNKHANDWAVRLCPILLMPGLPLLLPGPHRMSCALHLLASFRKGRMSRLITHPPNPASHPVCGCTLGTQ